MTVIGDPAASGASPEAAPATSTANAPELVPPSSLAFPPGTPTVTLSNGQVVPGDASWYSTSRLFKCLMGGCDERETLQYVHMRSLYKGAELCRRCETYRDWLYNYSPSVVFMKQKIGELGVDVTRKSFQCRICDVIKFNPEDKRKPAKAGFREGEPITICANAYDGTKGKLEDIMVHELVHAYDFARFKVDLSNIKHRACTEIRANALSGECRFIREFWNGPGGRINTRFKMHFQDCVRDRAKRSLMASGIEEGYAAKSVDSVWASCFRDTRPFDEIYR